MVKKKKNNKVKKLNNFNEKEQILDNRIFYSRENIKLMRKNMIKNKLIFKYKMRKKKIMKILPLKFILNLKRWKSYELEYIKLVIEFKSK